MKINFNPFCLTFLIFFCLFLLPSHGDLGDLKKGLQMPGTSYKGPLPPLTPKETALAKKLQTDVETLAKKFGPRNTSHYEAYQKTARYIRERFLALGYPAVRFQTFETDGKQCHNIEVEILGRAKEIVVIGAHYDSCWKYPGANDNASGIAALLGLAEAFQKTKPERTLRFVAFANEEPPHFKGKKMGSLVYAKQCKNQGDKIVAMICLETLGYYSDQEGSQKFPNPLLEQLYPSTGNFIAFVSNIKSRALLHQALKAFRDKVKFPSEGVALPGAVRGIDWSDHWSFWQQGYPALMITDTAPFRYPYYHTLQDTPDKIDYQKLARVVAGLEVVVDHLSKGSEEMKKSTGKVNNPALKGGACLPRCGAGR